MNLITALLPDFVGKLIAGGEDIWKAYINKEITKEELHTQLLRCSIGAFTDIERIHAESIAKTFDSFMQAAAKSKLMQSVWAAVALSQLMVLLWHQMAIPAIVFFLGVKYPSSGATVDWAYALVMFCLGGGAIALRMGPGAASIKDQIKSIIGNG